ncbi:MAG: hypothetical protein K0U38_00985 [Epsilonproteobacteria bacterium]|nr:hypothetical protein [Campylobacterota bacterium]
MKQVLTIAAMLSVGALGTLQAAGTAASTDISNTATLDYSVGSVAQTQLSASDAGFKVDRKIDLTVANTDTGKKVNVVPSATEQVLTYTIQNTGNDTDTYALSTVQADGSNGATDEFDPTAASCKIYDGASEITSVTLAADATKTLSVKCDIPAAGDPTVKDTQEASVWLLAEVTGRTKANDIADDPAIVQDVYADGVSAGSLTSDVSYDGKHSDVGTYHVATANMTIIKSSIVTNDPIKQAGGATEAHRIPGATVRYCFTVDNTGSSEASGVHVTDDMSTDGKANMTYVKSGMQLQDITTACSCAGIVDTSGTKSGNNVDIDLTTVTGSDTPATSRACAYIEATIN